MVLIVLFLALVKAEETFKPEAILIDPVPRYDTSSIQIENQPCGGRPKGDSHTLAEPGSINPVSWMVIHASLNSNCTVNLLDSKNPKEAVVLNPLDGSADSNGKFPCGRQEIYAETKDFVFPDYFCEECVLQWVWETYSGLYYQCSDVRVTRTYDEGCVG